MAWISSAIHLICRHIPEEGSAGHISHAHGHDQHDVLGKVLKLLAPAELDIVALTSSDIRLKCRHISAEGSAGHISHVHGHDRDDVSQ